MVASDIIVDIVDARVAAAQRRLTAKGTVANRISDSMVNVTFDGSNVPMAVRIFGDPNVFEGDRVALALIENDWVVMGTFTRRQGRGIIGTMYAAVGSGSAASSTTSEDAVDSSVWAQEPQFTILAGYLYRVFGVYQIYQDGTASMRGQFMIRQGRSTTTGAILQRSYLEPPTTANRVASFAFEGWFKNASGPDVTTYLSMCVLRDAGANTLSLYAGDSLSPLWVSVEEVSTVGANPSIAPMAIEIT